MNSSIWKKWRFLFSSHLFSDGGKMWHLVERLMICETLKIVEAWSLAFNLLFFNFLIWSNDSIDGVSASFHFSFFLITWFWKIIFLFIVRFCLSIGLTSQKRVRITSAAFSDLKIVIYSWFVLFSNMELVFVFSVDRVPITNEWNELKSIVWSCEIINPTERHNTRNWECERKSRICVFLSFLIQCGARKLSKCKLAPGRCLCFVFPWSYVHLCGLPSSLLLKGIYKKLTIDSLNGMNHKFCQSFVSEFESK